MVLVTKWVTRKKQKNFLSVVWDSFRFRIHWIQRREYCKSVADNWTALRIIKDPLILFLSSQLISPSPPFSFFLVRVLILVLVSSSGEEQTNFFKKHFRYVMQMNESFNFDLSLFFFSSRGEKENLLTYWSKIIGIFIV